MIRARKNAFLEGLLHRFFRAMLRGNFHAIHAQGAEHIRRLARDRPVIGYANHTNWWDGVVLLFLTRLQRRKDFYCMMEEKQMKHYPFFSWLGAFSVDLDNPGRSAATVRYALHLLRRPETFIWIFPQGEMVGERQEVRVRPGTDFMARRQANAQLLPAAFRYRFGREQKPEIYIRFGAAYPAHENSAEAMTEKMESLLRELDADLESGAVRDYEILLRPRLSLNKKWELFYRLLRGRWSGFRTTN